MTLALLCMWLCLSVQVKTLLEGVPNLTMVETVDSSKVWVAWPIGGGKHYSSCGTSTALTAQ